MRDGHFERLEGAVGERRYDSLRVPSRTLRRELQFAVEKKVELIASGRGLAAMPRCVARPIAHALIWCTGPPADAVTPGLRLWIIN